MLQNYDVIHDHVKNLVKNAQRRKALSGLRKYTQKKYHTHVIPTPKPEPDLTAEKLQSAALAINQIISAKKQQKQQQ